MNVEHMGEFAELAHDLNFTAAAKRLHITQPSLSNHIQALERECGCALVERGGRTTPRLTPAGQMFLDMCTEMLGTYNRTMPALRELGRENRGRVVVRTPRNECSYPFVDYLFEFRKLHPTIDVAPLPRGVRAALRRQAQHRGTLLRLDRGPGHDEGPPGRLDDLRR